jgi:hypothetical protein
MPLRVEPSNTDKPPCSFRGMQFASTRLTIIIIYSLLAVAMALPMLIIYFCIFRRYKKSRDEEYDGDNGFQLSNL